MSSLTSQEWKTKGGVISVLGPWIAASLFDDHDDAKLDSDGKMSFLVENRYRSLASEEPPLRDSDHIHRGSLSHTHSGCPNHVGVCPADAMSLPAWNRGGVDIQKERTSQVKGAHSSCGAEAAQPKSSTRVTCHSVL